jgi:hypothetical protein
MRSASFTADPDSTTTAKLKQLTPLQIENLKSIIAEFEAMRELTSEVVKNFGLLVDVVLDTRAKLRACRLDYLKAAGKLNRLRGKIALAAEKELESVAGVQGPAASDESEEEAASADFRVQSAEHPDGEPENGR